MLHHVRMPGSGAPRLTRHAGLPSNTGGRGCRSAPHTALDIRPSRACYDRSDRQSPIQRAARPTRWGISGRRRRMTKLVWLLAGALIAGLGIRFFADTRPGGKWRMARRCRRRRADRERGDRQEVVRHGRLRRAQRPGARHRTVYDAAADSWTDKRAMQSRRTTRPRSSSTAKSISSAASSDDRAPRCGSRSRVP